MVNRGLFCAPKSHSAKSGDILIVKFRRCCWHLVAGGQDAAKHPTMLSTDPTTENQLVQVTRAQTEACWREGQKGKNKNHLGKSHVGRAKGLSQIGSISEETASREFYLQRNPNAAVITRARPPWRGAGKQPASRSAWTGYQGLRAGLGLQIRAQWDIF